MVNIPNLYLKVHNFNYSLLLIDYKLICQINFILFIIILFYFLLCMYIIYYAISGEKPIVNLFIGSEI